MKLNADSLRKAMKPPIYVDPCTGKKLIAVRDLGNHETITSFRSDEGIGFPVNNGVANLIYPRRLDGAEEASRAFYDGRADQYEDTLHLTFKTHGLDEVATRKSFIDKLHISSRSRVLEIACGTGRDSVLIADYLGPGGELHLQDICGDMMRVCHKKLKDHPAVASFALANAQYLPYPDNYFDAVYSFGALGEFSDISKALKEMVRVTKIGGKVVAGDESMPVWLRDTEYFKILKETNPMFEAPLPIYAIPVEARNTSIHFVIGEAFYLFEFTVGEGEPTADFDFHIPGARGGTYRTRYAGKLEGVTDETKAMAWEAVKKKGSNMHEWLDRIIRHAAQEDLNSN